MIGGLQGEFRDLDIKYLKQNISKCRSHISGSFKRTPRHYAKIQVIWNVGRECSSGERYQRIQIWLTGEVETPPLPSGVKCRMWNIRSEDLDMSDRTEFREWDIRASQGGPSACTRCRDPSPWWYGARISIWRNSIWIPSGDMRRHAILRNSIRISQEDTHRHAIRTPSGRSTRHSWVSHPRW